MHSFNYQSHANEAAVIDMIEVCDEWYVRVLDRRGRQTVKTFTNEETATAFAGDKLARLGIQAIQRL